MSSELGAQSTICGGGRYDHLLSTIGGPDVPGIGFAMGIERVLLWRQPVCSRGQTGECLCSNGGVAAARMKVTLALRQAQVAADKDYLGRSLKAQLKYANRLGVRF